MTARETIHSWLQVLLAMECLLPRQGDKKETPFPMNNSEPHKYCSIHTNNRFLLLVFAHWYWIPGSSVPPLFLCAVSECLKPAQDGVNCGAQRPREGPGCCTLMLSCDVSIIISIVLHWHNVSWWSPPDRLTLRFLSYFLPKETGSQILEDALLTQSEWTCTQESTFIYMSHLRWFLSHVVYYHSLIV